MMMCIYIHYLLFFTGFVIHAYTYIYSLFSVSLAYYMRRWATGVMTVSCFTSGMYMYMHIHIHYSFTYTYAHIYTHTYAQLFRHITPLLAYIRTHTRAHTHTNDVSMQCMHAMYLVYAMHI